MNYVLLSLKANQLPSQWWHNKLSSKPAFTAKTVKLDLPAKFDGKPTALTSWFFDVKQYYLLVGIVSPTEMFKLTVSRLEKDVHTQWL